MSASLFHLEQYALCAALNTVPCWRLVTQRLTASDFTTDDHRAIFGALLTVTPAGVATDVVAVVDALRSSHRAALAEYVREDLLFAAPVYDALPNWITAIVADSMRRRSLVALRDAATALEDGGELEATERQLEQRLAAIRATAPDARVFDDKALMAASALAYLEDTERKGTPYGFAPWDAAVLPAQPSHLVLVGGASGAGKSAVARNLLRQQVQRYGRTVGWLTCEMSGEEQLVHLACMDSQVPLEDYYRQRLNGLQRDRFAAELKAWEETDRLRINEMGAVTPHEALRIFRRWREQGVTHFVLDHLHRLDYGATKSGDDLRVPVAAFARSLKNFAKDCEATVYALVQYSKIKPHEEPSDDKIREANNILEEADAVFHVYRPHIAHERDATGGYHALTKPDGSRYFEHDAPKGSTLLPDREHVYVKLGKQRRRLRDGMIRVPFHHELAAMYDTKRADPNLRLA